MSARPDEQSDSGPALEFLAAMDFMIMFMSFSNMIAEGLYPSRLPSFFKLLVRSRCGRARWSLWLTGVWQESMILAVLGLLLFIACITGAHGASVLAVILVQNQASVSAPGDSIVAGVVRCAVRFGGFGCAHALCRSLASSFSWCCACTYIFCRLC